MKKPWSLNVLVLPVILSLLCTAGCPPVDTTGSGSFTYDGETYDLTNGVLENYGHGDFDVVLASSGLNAAQWEGTGYFVWLDLVSPSMIGAPGRYDWAGTDDFLLYDGGVTFDYDADTEKGNWINADGEVAASEDHVTLSVDGRTYTIKFSLTLEDGEVVTGSYRGPLPVVYEN